jgi:ribosomal protein S30
VAGAAAAIIEDNNVITEKKNCAESPRQSNIHSFRLSKAASRLHTITSKLTLFLSNLLSGPTELELKIYSAPRRAEHGSLTKAKKVDRNSSKFQSAVGNSARGDLVCADFAPLVIRPLNLILLLQTAILYRVGCDIIFVSRYFGSCSNKLDACFYLF